MSYEPTIWKKGDKVTSTKLNKIENGIQGNDEEVADVRRIVDSIPALDTTLSIAGRAADAKATGDALATKVDKVTGKGLSENDYTTAEKTKLANIEDGATNVTIDSTLTQEGEAADSKAVGDEIAGIKRDLNDKANIDGTYDGMTVGSSRQLLSESYLLDEEPYLFRASGGDGSDRVEECVVGGSVVWNQLVADESKDFTNITTDNRQVGFDLWIGGSSNSSETYRRIITSVGLFGCVFNVSAATDTIRVMHFGSTIDIIIYSTDAVGLAVSHKYVFTAKFEGIDYTVVGGLVAKNIMLIDLTALLGSTIADYIYSLEQSTAGAGVAWFKKYFPEDYYPYSAPTLRHVEGVSQKEVVGFNQWDEEWEVGGIDGITGQNTTASDRIRSKNYIRLLPSTVYYAQVGEMASNNFRMYFYDSNKNFIGVGSWQYSGTFTTPSNVCYGRFVKTSVTTYTNEICISLSDPTKNGQYEPYRKNIYPLDSSLTLRGIPKLTDGKMWFDGDKYNADGTVQRRYGIVDLGTLDWVNYKSGGFNAQMSPSPKSGTTGLAAPNVIASKYFSWQGISVTLTDGMATITDSAIYVVDENFTTDASAFKTAMSGVYLVYELVTPTTEEATPYTALQTLDPNGTEEFVSTGIVPVGHYSKYLENLRSKIEGLPKDFSTLIAPTEKEYKATQNYTVGSLLIVDNILYKVTSAIANGGNITPNTNVTATTLAAVIAAL